MGEGHGGGVEDLERRGGYESEGGKERFVGVEKEREEEEEEDGAGL